MGQQSAKICHTQEITFDRDGGGASEWQAIDEWSEDKAVASGSLLDPAAGGGRCRSCCVPGDSKVEEVLVVHHEALQKINFLLRHDELQACESPAIPECVTAMRRARIQKRLQGQHRTSGWGPIPEQRDEGLDDDPSDEDVNRRVDSEVFETEGRSFDAFLARLTGTGFPVRALTPPVVSETSKTASEDFVLQLTGPYEEPHLSFKGPSSGLQVPLSSVVCVSCDARSMLPLSGASAATGSSHCAGGAAVAGGGDAERATASIYEDLQPLIYLAVTRVVGGSNCVEQFVFLRSQDAVDFREWMKYHHESQVLSIRGETAGDREVHQPSAGDQHRKHHSLLSAAMRLGARTTVSGAAAAEAAQETDVAGCITATAPHTMPQAGVGN